MSNLSSVSVSKFPYPYRAALSVCSDIDGTSLEDFVAIHRFLNTDHETPMGQGLSLPIADSFWMFSDPEAPEHALSYFDTSGKVTPAAPIIRDFIRAGLIDVMHSYGNFADGRYFSRCLAMKALEELDKHQLKIQVWTNHGGADSFQNIGQRSSGEGDLPTTGETQIASQKSYYHSDLLLNYGIKFYWDSESSLTTIVGQDRPAKFSEAHWNSPFARNFKQKLKQLLKTTLSITDQFSHKTIKKHIVPWEVFNGNNDLILPETLRDGQSIYRFRRFGHGRFDWSDDLPYLLNDQILKRLIEHKGYLILYIHLGDRRSREDDFPLSPESVSTLRKLAQLYHDGILWVTTTSSLLRYNLLVKTLNWSFQQNKDQIRIYLKGLSSPIFHSKILVSQLPGLTFLVPRVKQIELFADGTQVPFNRNPKDYLGRFSITVPLPSLQWPLD